MESTTFHSPPADRHGLASIYGLAAAVVCAIAGAAFVLGWAIGRILS